LFGVKLRCKTLVLWKDKVTHYLFIDVTDKLNRIGASTDPWGTPLVTGLLDEYCPPTHTCCHLPLSHALIQVNILPSLPCLLIFLQ